MLGKRKLLRRVLKQTLANLNLGSIEINHIKGRLIHVFREANEDYTPKKGAGGIADPIYEFGKGVSRNALTAVVNDRKS
jgi:hypothetical protein